MTHARLAPENDVRRDPMPPATGATLPPVQVVPAWAKWLAPHRPLETQVWLYTRVLRVLVAATLCLGTYYLAWRYLYSINWAYWWIALPLLVAETYSYLDAWLFGLGTWRLKVRLEPPDPIPGTTVDVFITCYNEPVELVRATAEAARDIAWPHNTYILDDGKSPAMQAMAQTIGVGYIVRSRQWQGKDRHAKAGNLINALGQTTGEFILILDADQIPDRQILARTLGYFRDYAVAFVQTPQWFYNTPAGNPFGSDAPLFYGPIQQGKDGWNAAYFCGSNAVLRREALMSIGIRYYVRDQLRQIRRSLRAADGLLRRAKRDLRGPTYAGVRDGIDQLRAAADDIRRQIARGEPLQEVTWHFQQAARAVSRALVQADLAAIQAELAGIPGLEEMEIGGLGEVLASEETLDALTHRDISPLAAVTAARALLLNLDVDRGFEAEAVLPIATISVTEDMATAMRMHATGWKSVYHHENLARGLAPEDLRTALQQRLRWAQGTIQVLLRENPLVQPGLSVGQRLMYFATMWSYLSGFMSVVYMLAPAAYFLFGWLPVRAYSADFFWHLVPYLAANQLLFLFLGWGLPTWRGQQYSLALFPLWIQAVTSAVANVYLGRPLGFVVTPKARQSGVYFHLIRPQLVAMGLLGVSMLVGVAQLAGGWREDGVPILVNVCWTCYNLILLNVVVDAATYTPPTADGTAHPAGMLSTALAEGRMGGGQR